MRVSSVVRVPVVVDRDSDVPLCRQIVDQLGTAIEAGALPAGSELPSSRALAQMLGVSRTVALAAYAELFARAQLRSRPGSGTFVAGADNKPIGSWGPGAGNTRVPSMIDFTPGRLNTEQFPVAAWRSAWQRASYHRPSGGRAEPLGLRPLREQVAAHLNRTRGLACDAGNIVINTGLAHGLDLLAKLAARPGGMAVVEDPTHPVVPATFAARGLTALSLAVDQDGAHTDCLPDHAALAVVTPSHQFPLAGTMSLARRHALLEWAVRNNTLVVELDIAAELHSHEAFMPCLSSLRPDAPVAHLGTFEHLLSEDLPLGYLVAPEQLVGPLEAHFALTRANPSALVQRAALDLFTSGELVRYMNRMHRTYQGKRAIVQDHLHAVPAIRLTGLAGNHVAVHLQDETSAEAVSAELAQHGVVAPTATDFFHTRKCDSNALILGFGHLADEELIRGLTLIRRTLATPTPAMARDSCI